MTRPAPVSAYDEDFFAWTQAQAAALRAGTEAAEAIDFLHLAEEIEALGRRDLRDVRSSLARFLDFMIRLECLPDADERGNWISEALHSQSWAAMSFSPSMRSLIDMAEIWSDSMKSAGGYLRTLGAPSFPPADCPFRLNQLVDEDFDFDGVCAALAALRAADRRA